MSSTKTTPGDPAAGLTYAEAVAGLQRRGRFGTSLGLVRIERLLAELGRPDRALRGALVGGTNGKGSVVALAGAALVEAGLRVGSMPKPHLVSYRERIAIDGAPVGEAVFAEAISRVAPAVDRVAADIGEPTEFEYLTAAAVDELARAAVDVALVEVGLGGRLDATNALDLGVAAITNVQRDHERHLGTTLRAIGAEKAAIVKPGNLAVTGARGAGLAPIRTRCVALGVPLRRAGPGGEYVARLRHAGWDGIVLDLERPAGLLDDLRIGLLGAHQAENAAVAVALLDALAERAAAEGRSLPLDEASLRRGLAGARWPGRLELLEGGALGIPAVLLDGAHNPAGVRALAAALSGLGLRRPAVVFGAMRGKRVAQMLRALDRLEPSVVFSRADAGPAALPPALLAAAWRRLTGRPGLIADDPAAALRTAAALAHGDGPLVVCGSLYLVGAVRALLVPRPEAR